MKLRWLIRSVLAGAAGTVALTLAYGAERRLRPRVAGPLDYDDSLVPGQIVAAIMHLPHVTAREEHELGMALRWSYSSVFGLWHGLLRRRAGEPLASVAFGATLMSATLTLFPLLGRTLLPWRWPKSGVATALGTQTAYVAADAAARRGSRVEPANRCIALIGMTGPGRRPTARCSRCTSDLPLPAHGRRPPRASRRYSAAPVHSHHCTGRSPRGLDLRGRTETQTAGRLPGGRPGRPRRGLAHGPWFIRTRHKCRAFATTGVRRAGDHDRHLRPTQPPLSAVDLLRHSQAVERRASGQSRRSCRARTRLGGSR